LFASFAPGVARKGLRGVSIPTEASEPQPKHLKKEPKKMPVEHIRIDEWVDSNMIADAEFPLLSETTQINADCP
jgi:hypothetical protein